MQKDEVPPEYLWEDSEGLERWWAQIEDKRSDGVGRASRSPVDSDSDDEDQEPGMAENDYARFLKQG